VCYISGQTGLTVHDVVCVVQVMQTENMLYLVGEYAPRGEIFGSYIFVVNLLPPLFIGRGSDLTGICLSLCICYISIYI